MKPLACLNGVPIERVSLSGNTLKTVTWYTPPIYTRGYHAAQVVVTMQDVYDGAHNIELRWLTKDENLSSAGSLTDWDEMVPALFLCCNDGLWAGKTISTVGLGLTDRLRVENGGTSPSNYLEEYLYGTPLPPVFRLGFIHSPAYSATYSVWLNLIC